jgi:hypothetical protein
LRAVTPDPRLGIAIELHKAGRLAEAEKLYREVLQRSPRDGNVLYLRVWLVWQQTGHSAQPICLPARSDWRRISRPLISILAWPSQP